MTSVAWGLSSTQSHSKLESAETRVSRGFRIMLFLFLLTSIWYISLDIWTIFQDLERKMSKEDASFRSVKETFEATEGKTLMKQEARDRLQRKVSDLNSRWEEMWRSHDVNKDRYVSLDLWRSRCFLPLDVIWQKHVNMLNCRISSGNLLTNLAGAYEWIN